MHGFQELQSKHPAAGGCPETWWLPLHWTMLRMTFYRVQGQVIQATPLTEEQVKGALTNAGLVVKKESLYEPSMNEKNDCDFTHLSFILAKKC